MSQKISLTRYLVEQQRMDGHIPSQLRLLLEVVARACKSISQAVNKGALGGVLGTASSENVQGEVQKKLDIIANEVLIEANEWGGHLAAMPKVNGQEFRHRINLVECPLLAESWHRSLITPVNAQRDHPLQYHLSLTAKRLLPNLNAS